MPTPKCTATTKAGTPCRMPVAVELLGLCIPHAAKAGDDEAKAEMKRRAAQGGKNTHDASLRAQRTSVSLRCYEDVAREYERLAIRAENGLDPAKVKAVCTVIDSARAAWHSGVLEKEVLYLRELVGKLDPKARLKSVP